MNTFYKYSSGFSDDKEAININRYGGKAYWINWLNGEGYKTPGSIFISNELAEQDDTVISEFIDQISHKLNEKSGEIPKIAMRSSSTIEDSFKESKAGNFVSYLGSMDRNTMMENYKKIVKSQSVDAEGRMGVIVQELIEPVVSGVIFSSNPLNYSKEEMLLSVIDGFGDRLMAGKAAGEDRVIYLKEGIPELSGFPEKYRNRIESLVQISKDIEQKLDHPVDIEWVMDKDEEIFIIQVRPINSFILDENKFDVVSIESMNGINDKLIYSDKVQLRLDSERYGIKMSRAYILTVNCGRKDIEEFDFQKIISDIERCEYCRGYSAVIIAPKNIDGKIVRAFVGNSSDVDESMYGSIESYPKYDSLKECLVDFINILRDKYWTASIIIQEIYEPEFTGIVGKSGDMTIIEITRGHFASKGILPMSRYILKGEEVIESYETEQNEYLNIVEGYVCRELCRPKERRIRLSSECLKRIATEFEPLMDDISMLEFGIISKTGGCIPYLIDKFAIRNGETVSDNKLEEIKMGIIYPGKIEGKLVKLKSYEESSIDIHFHNIIDGRKNIDEKTVFYAEFPDIAFMNILNNFKNDNISFIFKEGSILCHLSILFREKAIPSVLGYDMDSFEEGEYVELEIK